MFNLKFSEDTYKKFQKMDEILFSIISDEKDKSTDVLHDQSNIFGDDESTFLFIKDVASGKYERTEIEKWLRCNTHLSNP